jgi:Protein of unknown function (DUF3631)
VIAFVGELPTSLRERSLRIHLNRKCAKDVVEPLTPAKIAHLNEMCVRLVQWGAVHFDQLAAANPLIPDAIINRTRDNWRPLIAIADEAGGRWPETARALALKAAADAEADVSPGIAALRDIRQISRRRR